MLETKFDNAKNKCNSQDSLSTSTFTLNKKYALLNLQNLFDSEKGGHLVAGLSFGDDDGGHGSDNENDEEVIDTCFLSLCVKDYGYCNNNSPSGYDSR